MGYTCYWVLPSFQIRPSKKGNFPTRAEKEKPFLFLQTKKNDDFSLKAKKRKQWDAAASASVRFFFLSFFFKKRTIFFLGDGFPFSFFLSSSVDQWNRRERFTIRSPGPPASKTKQKWVVVAGILPFYRVFFAFLPNLLCFDRVSPIIARLQHSHRVLLGFYLVFRGVT